MSPCPTTSLVRVTSDALSVDEALAFVADPAAGGTCVFVGTVRDLSDAGDVTGLIYEAWDELAVRRLRRSARSCSSAGRSAGSPCCTASARSGSATSASSIAVLARPIAPRRSRRAATAIERLKQDVPIWKKEASRSGEAHWVMGT